MSIERYLARDIQADVADRIVLITGPRQVGKTTVARALNASHDYLNYDLAEDRARLASKSWDRKKAVVVFDELHKMKSWKRWLKGIYDTEGIPPGLVVTGSAHFDLLRRAGDSLAGRYFRYRLHPFDLAEVAGRFGEEESFNRLMAYGGFPEPFLRASGRFYGRWKSSHLDVILRQDLIDLAAVRDIPEIGTLVELLRTRVGSPLSYAVLARLLERDPKTIKHWLSVLEQLYVIFSLRPYSKSVDRSLRKEPKYYFYDVGHVKGDAAKFENIVACALLKECHRLEDVEGKSAALHYLRTKEKKEIDFLFSFDGVPLAAVEAKWAAEKPSDSFTAFSKRLSLPKRVQLVRELEKEATFQDGLEVRRAVPWLARIQKRLSDAPSRRG